MNGLPYYKAYPRDFIEGTIGMPFEVKCAYRVVLDLIYMQGGDLPDDDRYISGLLGCSIRKWKSIRAALIEGGKIEVSGEFLTNKRARNELETLAKLQDKKRGNRSRPNKNKDLQSRSSHHTEPEPDIDTDIDLPSAPTEGEAIDDAGGDIGSDRDQDFAFIKRLKAAMNVTAERSSSPYWTGGGAVADVERWRGLGLTRGEIVREIAAISARPSSDPPQSLRYFDRALRELAGRKAEENLTPETPPRPPGGVIPFGGAPRRETYAEATDRRIREGRGDRGTKPQGFLAAIGVAQ